MTTVARELHLPAQPGGSVNVTPETAGWGYSGLRTISLEPGASLAFSTGPDEVILLPLAGTAEVRTGNRTLDVAGRKDVFSAASDFVYLPPSSEATLAAPEGGRFALCSARTDARLPVRHVPADEVPVEVRGAGVATRLVRNFATADVFPAGAIIACEVITPGGNWSSYPAHKHDEATETEAELEEIYYFEVAPGPHGEAGIGFHRTSSSPRGEIDVLAEVRTGDVALVPYGWHGPTVAAPGFDMYYLNVMAGPAPTRRWLISDHPDQAFVRDTWTTAPVDPRVLDGRYSA